MRFISIEKPGSQLLCSTVLLLYWSDTVDRVSLRHDTLQTYQQGTPAAVVDRGVSRLGCCVSRDVALISMRGCRGGLAGGWLDVLCWAHLSRDRNTKLPAFLLLAKKYLIYFSSAIRGALSAASSHTGSWKLVLLNDTFWHLLVDYREKEQKEQHPPFYRLFFYLH